MSNLVFAELAMLIGGKVESIEKTYLMPEDALYDDAVYGLRIKGKNNGVVFDKVIWILSDFEGNGAGGFSIEDFV